jgi:hypothetical protein
VNRGLVRICLVTATAMLAGRLPADEVAADPAAADVAPVVEVRVDLVAGEPLTGRLVAIDRDSLRLIADGAERAIPIAAVRQVARIGAAPATPPAVRLTTTDGGTVAGADFVQDGARGIMQVGSGRIELPSERVRRVAWLATGEIEPGWVAAMPERPESDLVVVRREDGQEFVACAVVGVSAEHVTVVLDGETIPVKRAKVIGVEWLREEAAAGGIVVRLGGGQLAARDVRWSAEAFAVDDIRLPPDTLTAIDFAAGRTTPLAGLPLETVTTEPFLGVLAADKQLAAFFAPRTVAAADGGIASLVVRPRTVATWRVPTESRRFRGAISRTVPAEAAAAVDVAVAVDGREAWRRRLGGGAGDEQEPVAIDLEVAGGRRLTLTVDFVPGDMGCGVRLTAGAFEK